MVQKHFTLEEWKAVVSWASNFSPTMPDIQTREDIQAFIEAFYAAVRQDATLAPHFAHVDWPVHTPRIVDFWESTVLHTGAFSGNVMEVHTRLHQQQPLLPAHFAQWLHLFRTTLAARHAGPNTALALARAEGIAWLMENKVVNRG